MMTKTVVAEAATILDKRLFGRVIGAWGFLRPHLDVLREADKHTPEEERRARLELDRILAIIDKKEG